MLSEQEFFRFVEEKIDNLTGYAESQVEVGNSRKELDKLLNGYPYCIDEVAYKAYSLLVSEESFNSLCEAFTNSEIILLDLFCCGIKALGILLIT